MKLCHAAALALVGWYLMIPPIEFESQAITSNVHVSSDAPFSKWEMSGSFDTAKECDAARLAIGSPSDSRHELSGGNDAAKAVHEKAYIEIAKGNSQCIATDDPRLKEKQK
jgi:hypothetical protein